MFIGRSKELKELRMLTEKKTSSLVSIMGRRRIGKSTLISEFGKHFKSFISIQGLGPDLKAGKTDQLKHFAEELSIHFNSKKEHFESWNEAFQALAEKTKNGKTLILLDEISWMSQDDPLFAVQLKDAWDTKFKKNNKLVMVLCGSVSSWIEDNILKNTSFEGRISLQLQIEELSIKEIKEFWKQNNFSTSTFEAIQILSVTGGVPKYLEEILKSQTAEQNLIRMCFNKSGILFSEFDKIFIQIFKRHSESLERIVRLCLNEKLSPSELAIKLKRSQDSHLTKLIHILEISGFISRDYYFNPDGSPSKLSHLRLKDNYLRFYLNYIEPKKNYILKGGKVIQSLSELKNWNSIVGLQFENLLLQNRDLILKHLDLNNTQIISMAPYFQRKKTTNKGACQIDLLIHTNLNVFYICEFKCRKEIDSSVITEVQKKTAVIQLPRRSAIKTVLIYEGEMSNKTKDSCEDYFHKMISFDDLINN